ncbi:ATP-grasp domain-containing protein [Pseudomonas sp. KCJK9016]|uniref:ATP-grasp domain-containing protein n=1 Tax=Pseudomonas sp. KCJK9016 TaxID=3344556 RepID=UPI003905B68B
MTTVLVTGVGAIIGYGLLRSLKTSDPKVRLVGTDIFANAVGQAWCDVFEQAPLTKSAGYLQWLGETIEKHKVDLVIPGIEQDVYRLSDERDSISTFDCKFVLNNPELISLSRDKWAMHQALLNLDDPSRIPSYLTGEFASLSSLLGTPFILKPRSGYASKGLVKVKSAEDFISNADTLGDHLLAQPLIGTDDDEYTVGVFGNGTGSVCASISMQRYLSKDGSTANARIVHDDSLLNTVIRLCTHFNPVGPTNLQFRRDGLEWKLLEINPRVSSTSSIRTAFGFNEAAMCVDFYLNRNEPSQPTIKSGFATRFIEDLVIYDRDHF